MARVCSRPGCPEFANARGTYCDRDDPRPALYTRAWKKHSRERRSAQGTCVECGQPAVGVDHPTDDPLCIACHNKRETRRRQQ